MKLERDHIDAMVVKEGPILTVEKQIHLIHPFTKDEIKEAMLSINVNKTLGLDEYGSGFFKFA